MRRSADSGNSSVVCRDHRPKPRLQLGSHLANSASQPSGSASMPKQLPRRMAATIASLAIAGRYSRPARRVAASWVASGYGDGHPFGPATLVHNLCDDCNAHQHQGERRPTLVPRRQSQSHGGISRLPIGSDCLDNHDPIADRNDGAAQSREMARVRSLGSQQDNGPPDWRPAHGPREAICDPAKGQGTSER